MLRSLLAVGALALAVSAQDPKPVDLAPLRDAVEKALKRGENVDGVSKALDAFEKAGAKPNAGAVPRELQALRAAVDAAARKGENVEAIAKELAAVETAVAGKPLEKPKPKPEPLPEDPRPNPRPGFPGIQPFPAFPQPGIGGGGIDRELFDKAMALRREATELMLAGNRDPESRAKAQKMLAEATEMLNKAIRGGIAVPNPVPFPQPFPANDRGRLGVRMERVPAVAADQLGLEPNVGIAINFVSPNSPAEKAGLKVNDIILEFAGKPVSDSTEEFVRRVAEVKANEKVDLVVLRKGKKVDVKGVELPAVAARPEFPRPAPLPFPAFPELPQVRPIPLPAPVAVPDGFDSVSYTSNGDSFTLKAKKGDTTYTITGALDAAGAPVARTVTIGDGTTSVELAADKLPDARRREVDALLKTVQRVKP